MQGRSHSHKSRKVMVQVYSAEGHHNQFQVNIWCHYYFQYIAFSGKNKFEAKSMLFHEPHIVLTFQYDLLIDCIKNLQKVNKDNLPSSNFLALSRVNCGISCSVELFIWKPNWFSWKRLLFMKYLYKRLYIIGSSTLVKNGRTEIGR